MRSTLPLLVVQMEDDDRRFPAEPSSSDHRGIKSKESSEGAEMHEYGGEGLPESDIPDETDWLFSLPESQLDLLICLKELAILRSKNAGLEELANKFHPKMLRMLGALVVEYVKERMKGSSILPFTSEDLRHPFTGCLMPPPKENHRKRALPDMSSADSDSIGSTVFRSAKRQKTKEEPG